jgi:hypothetical protein
MSMTADEIIARLDLEPHPEGGHFRETFRDEMTIEGRSVGTAIFFLLKAGEVSRWHRVDASETWHFYSGAPLLLGITGENGNLVSQVLGTGLEKGELPQFTIPKGKWQQARSTGEWTLVGCTVAPGFEFSGFEMAEEGWEPASSDL